ncbi:MAG: DHH family phosphoesterase, partial [Deinococcus sp.]|nr:DHH family phosphoesterase [Deinococcus sp.]
MLPERTMDDNLWCIQPPPLPAELERIMAELGVGVRLATLLFHRGVRAGNARRYLHPELVPVPMHHLDEAVARLAQALQKRQRILIHGDYDADGVTGTAVLLLGLGALGAEVRHHIPNRLTDGYGLKTATVQRYSGQCELMLTVDCGITSVEPVEAAKAAGLEVIVTDHHTPDLALPQCLVVSPKVGRDAPSPLAGVGVAYHLLWVLHRSLGLEDPTELLDLVALGTIADVADLGGDNRPLVRRGLEVLQHSTRPGIVAMRRQSRLDQVDTQGVAFRLAPRINAAGRLGEADKALELLTTPSLQRAQELSLYLEARNQLRQRLQEEIHQQARQQVRSSTRAIVVSDPSWHHGVIGIVAAKLLEEFYRPVFIIGGERGSARSTPGISAVEAVRYASQYLKGFG